MDNYITIEQTVKLAEAVYGCKYTLVNGKRIAFEAIKDSKRLCMCTPESKYHAPQNCYWVDITSKQYDLLDSYDEAFLFFRLEGMKFALIGWNNLKPCLTPDAMTNNLKEGDHWKLQIHNDHIRIGKSDNIVSIEVRSLSQPQS